MAAAADKRAHRKEGSSSIQPETRVDVMSAIKTAISTLVFSAISEAATTQQEINKIKTEYMMYHPLSSLTDIGLLS